MTTAIIRCSVIELVAIERAARGRRQFALLDGHGTWTRRDYPFLERLRDVRGLNVIEEHTNNGIHVTICGTIRMDGFTKRF